MKVVNGFFMASKKPSPELQAEIDAQFAYEAAQEKIAERYRKTEHYIIKHDGRCQMTIRCISDPELYIEVFRYLNMLYFYQYDAENARGDLYCMDANYKSREKIFNTIINGTTSHDPSDWKMI